jgi:hypothetical protein
MKQMIATLFAIVFMVLGPCQNSWAQDPAPETADNFPMFGWWGPVSEKSAIYAYRRCGFSLMPMPYGRVSGNSAEYARQIGLKTALHLPRPMHAEQGQIKIIMDHIAPVTHIIAGDDVPAANADELNALLESLSKSYPDAQLAASLQPSADLSEWRSALPRLKSAGLDAFLFHFLPLGTDDETNESRFFELLNFSREMQEQHGLDMWALTQVTPAAWARRGSESDIRFQAYSALAFGSRGLAYFAYSDPPLEEPPPDWGPAMVERSSGEVQYGYVMTALLNQELRQLAPRFQEMTSRSVYFAGDTPGTLPQLPARGEVFRRIVAPRALCGFFEGDDGAEWALLVNLRHGDNRSALTTRSTIQVLVDPAVSKVFEVDRYTGYEKPVPFEAGSFYVTVPGGTGSLFRVERGGA